jgi:hypothetical protein
MADLRSQRRTFIFFDTPDCAIMGTSVAGPASAGTADPASILDIRSTGGPGGSRGSGGGMLSPMPGSIGSGAPAGAPPQAGMNLRGSTPATPGAGRTSVFY